MADRNFNLLLTGLRAKVDGAHIVAEQTAAAATDSAAVNRHIGRDEAYQNVVKWIDELASNSLKVNVDG